MKKSHTMMFSSILFMLILHSEFFPIGETSSVFLSRYSVSNHSFAKPRSLIFKARPVNIKICNLKTLREFLSNKPDVAKQGAKHIQSVQTGWPSLTRRSKFPFIVTSFGSLWALQPAGSGCVLCFLPDLSPLPYCCNQSNGYEFWGPPGCTYFSHL